MILENEKFIRVVSWGFKCVAIAALGYFVFYSAYTGVVTVTTRSTKVTILYASNPVAFVMALSLYGFCAWVLWWIGSGIVEKRGGR